MNRPKIKVAIADDHHICIDGIISILDDEKFIIVGNAKNGQDLIQIVNNSKPDIVFLDIQMPIMDGAQAAKIIQKEHPEVKIIALTMHAQESCITEMLDAGATGYLLKSADKTEILKAIDAILKNQIYLIREIKSDIIEKIIKRKSKTHKPKNIADLTDTEIQIIKLICDEYTSEEIGKLLFLSKRTIDGARQRIQIKVSASSTAGIVKFALENGIYRK